MEAVPARRQRLHQCRIGELLKGRLGTGQLAVGHSSSDADVDLWHAEQAEQPERSVGLGLKLPVAQREARAYAQLAHGQPPQSLTLVLHERRECLHRPRAASSQPGSGDP
jgi:hypothetical protein